MPSPTEVFECLADKMRVRATLLIVDQGELCARELMCVLADSRPKISHHLAQLRSAGLLLDRRQGQWVYYRLNSALSAWIYEVLQVTLWANGDWLQTDAACLCDMDGRPQRVSACCQ